jgi:hypothetical protein
MGRGIKRIVELEVEMTNVEAMLQEENGTNSTDNEKAIEKNLYKNVERELDHEIHHTEFVKVNPNKGQQILRVE